MRILLSITGLLRTLIVILILYYVLKLIFHYLLPVIRKSPQASDTNKTTRSYKRISDKIGEYIDFEEIQDDKK